MPVISAIIPTFNRAGFIKKAASSVLSQSLDDLELIIVDDGSGDSTRETVLSLNDKRIRYFFQENRGVSAARNLGLSKASGRFAALLDCDDYWMPRKLEKQLEFMLEGGFRIAQTREIWIRNNKRVNPKDKHLQPAGWIFENSLKLCLISPSCVMMDMDLVRQGHLFNERLRACEDYDLWLRICLEYPVGLLPEALTVRTAGHFDQLSKIITGQDLFRIYSLLDLDKKPGLSPGKKLALKKALKEKSRIYIQGCAKRGRNEEAERIKELLRSA